MRDRVVLGEQEGLAHGDGVRQFQRRDVQVAILLNVVFIHDAGCRIARENCANLATLQVEVVLGGVAPIQREFQTVHIDGQWSHEKGRSRAVIVGRAAATAGAAECGRALAGLEINRMGGAS